MRPEVGFVETAKLKVKLFAQNHACTRDGGKVLHEMGAREIPIFIANAGVGVIRAGPPIPRITPPCCIVPSGYQSRAPTAPISGRAA